MEIDAAPTGYALRPKDFDNWDALIRHAASQWPNWNAALAAMIDPHDSGFPKTFAQDEHMVAEETDEEDPEGTYDRPLSSGGLIRSDATLLSLWLAVARYMLAFIAACSEEQDMTDWVRRERDRLVPQVTELSNHVGAQYLRQDGETVLSRTFAAFLEWVLSWATPHGDFRFPAYPEGQVDLIENLSRSNLNDLFADQRRMKKGIKGKLYWAPGWPHTIFCLGEGHSDLGVDSMDVDLSAEIQTKVYPPSERGVVTFLNVTMTKDPVMTAAVERRLLRWSQNRNLRFSFSDQ